MIPLQIIRENPEHVIERLAVKNFDARAIVTSICKLDDERKAAQRKLDDSLAEANNLAREIGNLYKAGKTSEADVLKLRTAALKEDAKKYGETFEAATEELNRTIVILPNMPHSSVARGKTPEDNEIVHSEGVIPELPADAVPHWDLTTRYDIISFELGSKVTGAGFPFYKGQGARLQRALINFFLDEAIKAGFTEYQPPLMVNEASAFAT